MIDVAFSTPHLPDSGTVVLTVAKNKSLGVHGNDLDTKTNGVIRRALAASRFTGKECEVLTILAPANSKLARIVLVGVDEGCDPLVFERAGSAGFAEACKGTDHKVSFIVDHGEELAAHVALGARVRSWKMDAYRTKQKPEDKISISSITIISQTAAKDRKLWHNLAAVVSGMELARNLVTEPPNVLYPETFAQRCLALKTLGIKVEVLGLKELQKLGMNALLGVGQGSIQEPRVVVLGWHGKPADKNKKPLVFIGKGVTFDTGGISLKPAAGMEDMKYDMAGAAAVIGAMHALATRKAPVNVVGIVGLVENMPGGKAQRPADVVTSFSGQTIEVINTDAEGRLVLADVIAYAARKFSPRAIIDLATLTGAIVIALGHENGGLFANDDVLAAELTAAGNAVGENLWRMPIDKQADRAIESTIADMRNVGDGRESGSSIGAAFLQRFVPNDTPWAHLDIAGMAWSKKGTTLGVKGATAFGVRILDRFADNY